MDSTVGGVMARKTGLKALVRQLTVLAFAGFVAYALWGRHRPAYVSALVAIAALLFWLCFIKPSLCDYQTGKGRACTSPVNGKLRGCWRHRRLKRDAIFAALDMRNPGQVFRVMWSAPHDASSLPQRGSVSSTATPTRQAAYDVAILMLTLVSTIAAVAALFV